MSQPPNQQWRPKTIDHLATLLVAVSFLLGNLDVLGHSNAWWTHPISFALVGVTVGLVLGNWIARKDGMVPQEEHFQGQPSRINTVLFWAAILASFVLIIQVVVHTAFPQLR